MRVVLWGYAGVAEDFAVLDYDTVSRDYQIVNVSRSRSVLVFKGRNILLFYDFSNLETEDIALPRGVLNHLPINAASYTRRKQSSANKFPAEVVGHCRGVRGYRLRMMDLACNRVRSFCRTPLCLCRTDDCVWYGSYGDCWDVSSVSVFDLASDPKVSSQQYKTSRLGYVY
jgi:hypothetical protein